MGLLDDKAQGEPNEDVCDLDLDTDIIENKAWQRMAKRGLGQPCQFGLFLYPLRGTDVLVTDLKPFHALFRNTKVQLAKPSFSLRCIATFLGGA